MTAGAVLPAAAGSLVRRPAGGRVGQIAIETDGTNAGLVEIYDMSGLDVLADVSSATVITNAQLTTALAAGKAKKLWEMNISASVGAPVVWAWSHGFLRGLVARFSNSGPTGACHLNVTGEGGFQYYTTAGVYAGG